jgi:hypothetical protein
VDIGPGRSARDLWVGNLWAKRLTKWTNDSFNYSARCGRRNGEGIVVCVLEFAVRGAERFGSPSLKPH